MNRRGYGIIGFVFLFILLLIMWPFIIAPLFNQAGVNAVASGATGLEAFFWTNLNLWFFFTLIIIVVVFMRLGGGE